MKEQQHLSHKGWDGVPFESDFISARGTIKREAMMDCRQYPNNVSALDAAKIAGYEYFIAPQRSKYGNQLYKNRSGVARCLYAELQYDIDRAAKQRAIYNNNKVARINQMIRAARSRAKAKGLDVDLDNDMIVQRFLSGKCEATGLPFNYTVNNHKRHSLSPSIDRIDPSRGYTMNNVQIVCLFYNLMKSNFNDTEITDILLYLKGSPYATID